MKELLKIEFKKSLKNKSFYVSIIIASVFTILSLIFCINNYQNDMRMMRDLSRQSEITHITYAPQMQVDTLFNHWVGGEPVSLGTSVYFFIFPILCAIPYGWSYCVERKSGYTRTMIVHSGKKVYFLAKYIVTFVSGGLAMVIPLVLNIMMAAALFPAIKPDVTYGVHYAVFKNSLMSELFYTRPFLYVFLYLCMDFVFCGLLACCSMAAASFVRQKYIVTLVPFMICLALHFSMKFTYDFNNYYNKEFSPFYYLRPSSVSYPTSFFIIGMTAMVLFVITFTVTNVWEKRHEIY